MTESANPASLPHTLRKAIWVLAVFACVRGCLGGLSFPFFGHLDEAPHLDVVLRYAAGDVPRPAYDDLLHEEMLELFVLYNSPEFNTARGPEGPAPVTAQIDWPPEMRDAHVAATVAQLAKGHNHEALEAPPYYALAAVWLGLGRALGFEGLDALYWVRMLGGLSLGCAVLLTAALLRRFVPDQPFIWFGAAALLAVWPQDVYYFVNNDVPSVALGPLAILLVDRVRCAERPGMAGACGAGVVLGVAAMTKVPNLAIPCAALALLGTSSWRAWQEGAKARWTRHLALFGAAAATYLSWTVYTLAVFGRTGSSHKPEALGITPKGGDYFDHPLFSIEGLWTFVEHVSKYFWRGEIRWHDVEMHVPWVDRVLLGTTLLFAVVSAVVTIARRGGAQPPGLPWPLARVAWGGLLASLGFLVCASVLFDYGPNHFPSRDFPFMCAGRLVSASFVFAAAIWLDGLRAATAAVHPRLPWILLGATALVLLVSELVLMAPVIASPHNFWNLDV